MRRPQSIKRRHQKWLEMLKTRQKCHDMKTKNHQFNKLAITTESPHVNHIAQAECAIHILAILSTLGTFLWSDGLRLILECCVECGEIESRSRSLLLSYPFRLCSQCTAEIDDLNSSKERRVIKRRWKMKQQWGIMEETCREIKTWDRDNSKSSYINKQDIKQRWREFIKANKAGKL